MACQELDNLRKTASATRLQIREQQLKTRRAPLDERRSLKRGNGDMIVFLQRKLLRESLSIERHIADHGCQS